MENSASETVHPLDNILNSVTVEHGNLMDDFDPINQTIVTNPTESNNVLQPSEVNPQTLNDDVFGPHDAFSATDIVPNTINEAENFETTHSMESEQPDMTNDNSAMKVQRVRKRFFIQYLPSNINKLIRRVRFIMNHIYILE